MKEITPAHLRCCVGTCPGVYEVDAQTIVVVGKRAAADQLQELTGRIGDDEYAVVISKDFFSELKEG